MSSSFKVLVGVDVSQSVVVATIMQEADYLTFKTKNECENFEKELFKRLTFSVRPCEILIVVEATGVYHLKFVFGLEKKGYVVSVVNPFVIKKFAEMKMKRVKTDPVDSRMILEYAKSNLTELRIFKPKDEVKYEIEVKIRILDDLYGTLRRLKNQRHAVRQYPLRGKEFVKAYDEVIQKVSDEIKKIEKDLEELAYKKFNRQYNLLLSIPGVGKRLAWIILGYLKGFEGFNSAREVVSYIGICPSPWESGKTVKGGKISKKGSGLVRKVLYVYAWSACRFNKDCEELYQRLISRGKCKKVAMVAVANKLIRQAFGVLRNGINYIPDFHLHRQSLCEI